LQDNDEPGVKKALAAAQALFGTAKTVRIVLLPDLPAGGDVSNWFDRGGTIEHLLKISFFDTPLWEPPSSASVAPERDPDTEIPDNDDNDDDPKIIKPITAKRLLPPPPPIQWLDMSNWDDEPRPEREWAIPDRVPLNQTGLFSGEGGAGKSILEMMKDVAHVCGKDWLGSLPAIGPAFYLGAEDDEREIHIRFFDIAAHYGVTFTELIAGGLHVLCKSQDATLCTLTRSGKVEITTLYKQLYEAAGDIKPKNISIDTLSRAFAGNEIDRVQVYAFAMHMQALAKVADGAVTVLSHPSLQGISSGTGLSGSTAWHGAFRFRQYLTSPKSTDDEQPDNDLRQLEFKKNQYGPRGETIVLRYQRGLFLPVAATGTLEKLAEEQKADNLFLELLDKFQGQGRNVSHLKNANAYAPTQFSKDPKAKTPGIHKAMADAMERLFAAKKIKVENYGRPSRLSSRIVRCQDEDGER
jgi:RecA-family ATPase